MKRHLGYYLGNFLMVGALSGLIIIYYPVFSVYINPPKISAQAPIVSGVDPWNESEYMEKLQQGIADARGSVNPGEKGEIYLFAHSSEAPWEMTRINTAFLRLGELQMGDKVTITKDGKNFTYLVYDKKELWPTETSYLKDLDKNYGANSSNLDQTLILQTCTPIGTALKRLLVFAKPV
jgi:sortase A